MNTKMKIAVVSNYKESCGIASYTGAIVDGLKLLPEYEIEVFSIDMTLAKASFKKAKSLRKLQFEKIAEQIKEFDVVNIQFENGLFGMNHSEVLSNLSALLNEKSKFVFTMHTADFFEGQPETGFVRDFVNSILGLEFKKALKAVYNSAKINFMERFIKTIRVYDNVSIIVHTKREELIFKKFFGFERVYSHPLVFLQKDKAKEIRANVSHDLFKERYRLNETDKVLTVYGFVSEYKGHLTAINAIRLLPESYKLFIVGSQHPQSIERHKESNKYFEKLYAALEGKSISTDKDFSLAELKEIDVSGRVEFLGFVSDDEMLDLMVHSDVCLYPYLETGQSGSGPASLCLEVGGKMLASNALVFSELDKFAPESFQRFDIGNYFELAQKTKKMAEMPYQGDNVFNSKYNLEENIDFYVSVFKK
jgi:glycosyltransferase involved in cell wall biosynthesis